jgi:hypothetical protein
MANGRSSLVELSIRNCFYYLRFTIYDSLTIWLTTKKGFYLPGLIR